MVRALPAACTAWLLLPTCCALGAEPTQGGVSACAPTSEEQEECTALMQLGLKVRTGSHGVESNGVYPVGRTIISTDPRATAEWMVKYQNGTSLVALPGCDHAERAAVRISDSEVLIFIKDESLPKSDADPLTMIPRIDAVVDDLFETGSNYTFWFDNHDGYYGSTLDFSAAVANGDHVGAMRHYIEGELTTSAYLMYFYPHTMLANQVIARDGTEGLASEDFVQDDCRVAVRSDSSLLQEDRSLWWKATYVAADPASASQFAEEVLGAEAFVGSYPWPPKEGCTAALWAKLPGSGFQLHFVYSPEYQPRAGSLQDFTDRVLAARNLEAGTFDPYMHNSLIMTVENLDPYVERLRARSLGFLLLDGGDGNFALFTSIPGNDITVQLRSKFVSAAVPSDLSVCTQQFPL